MANNINFSNITADCPEPKTLETIAAGDKIYYVQGFKVFRYDYLCVHPKSENYHILIDSCEEPIRVYKDKLELMLSQKLVNRKDANNLLLSNFHRKIAELNQEQAIHSFGSEYPNANVNYDL